MLVDEIHTLPARGMLRNLAVWLFQVPAIPGTYFYEASLDEWRAIDSLRKSRWESWSVVDLAKLTTQGRLMAGYGRDFVVPIPARSSGAEDEEPDVDVFHNQRIVLVGTAEAYEEWRYKTTLLTASIGTEVFIPLPVDCFVQAPEMFN